MGCSKKVKNESGNDLSLNSNQKEEKVASTNEKIKVALIMKTLTNPFFIEMERGARRAEVETGIELIVKTGAEETSIQQQIAIVEEMISSKVKAIVIAPGSSTDLIPVLKKAKDAGIVIVNIDNRLNKEMCQNLGLGDIPFISVNNEIGGYNSAKYIVSKITKPTKAVILEGIRDTENAQQRKAGAVRAFAESKDITIVASETANWKIDEANTIIEKMFEKNSNIGAVFCANDMMALGVLQYLDKVGKKDVLVAGYDALEEAKKAVKAGTLQVTIDQQADVQGYTGVKYALQLIAGKNIPYETFIDTKIVDKESLK